MEWYSIPLVIVGIALIVAPVDAAVRTFVLPRGVPVVLSRFIFRSVHHVFSFIAKPARDYESRDRVMALYAPIALLILPIIFLLSLFAGFFCINFAFDTGWRDALTLSGGSLLTLGFERPPSIGLTLVAFVEAALGLGLVALLIAYLPTIYNAFSRREVAVTGLAVRAGTPPTAVELLERAQLAGFVDRLEEFFEQWEVWFQELSETHTSLAVLSFFRSPNPHRSWVTASACVLDAAALRYAVIDMPWTPEPGVCIRSGYLALREIADFYGIQYDADPAPDDPVSIAREEFDEVYQRLARSGMPMQTDRDQAWRVYRGWRVNYDTLVIALAALVMAPYAPWSSDRSSRYHGPAVRLRNRYRPVPPAGR